MKAIFKNENVYVVIDDTEKELREDVNIDDFMILCQEKEVYRKSLYGGRVYLSLAYSYGRYQDDFCEMTIDGISIFKVDYSSNIVVSSEISIDVAAAYLNQIENLGVDSFLENYKLQLQDLKKECETKVEVLRQDLTINYDEKKASFLKSLENFILSITFVIFSLLVNMNAGLDNHCYTDAYNTIISMYF